MSDIAVKTAEKRDTRFKPGNPGGGRPKGPSLTTALMAEFRKARGANDKRSMAAVARAVIDAALGGDMKAASMIWERTDGKVRDELIVTDGPQEIRVIRDRPDAAA